MKNEHPAFFLSEQDDIVNSLSNYEGIAVIELQFYHFPDSDRLRVGSVTPNSLMISSYGILSTTRNNPSYYYQATNAASIALECFQRHLMFYTCNYNIRVTHRNGAIHIFCDESDPREGSSADCSLFILSLHALALSSSG